MNEDLRQEIAERQRAEDALRRGEDHLRLVIDTIPALVWSKLPDGSADFFNQRFREYTGLPLEEGLGEGWMKAIHPEDRSKFEDEWRTALAAGKPFDVEARLRRADGEYRWFLLRGVPLCDNLGNIIKWYGTTTDMEDRKRAAWALRKRRRISPTSHAWLRWENWLRQLPMRSNNPSLQSSPMPMLAPARKCDSEFGQIARGNLGNCE